MLSTPTTQNRTPEHETNKDGQKTDERLEEQSQLKSSGHIKMHNTDSRLRNRENESTVRGQTFDTSSHEQTVLYTQTKNRDDYETISGNGESQTQKVSRDGSSLSDRLPWHTDHGSSGPRGTRRVHRLKALGNSIVPKIAEEIGRAHNEG